jgi:hypothetical protein
MLTLLLSSVLSFYHIQEPVATLYASPSLDAPAISQGAFAEAVTILDREEGWVKIQLNEDKGCGWAPEDAVCGREKAYADCTCVSPIVEVIRLAAPVYESPSLDAPILLTVPFESHLEADDPYQDPDNPWITVHLPNGTAAYLQRENVTTDIHAIPKEQLLELSQCFFHVPYLPGGRSSFGYDSAGFIQVLYKQIGLMLPSNVPEQFDSDDLEAIDIPEPGDLLFWDTSHVGLYLGNRVFIHACEPEIQIDSLDTPPYNTQYCAKRLK